MRRQIACYGAVLLLGAATACSTDSQGAASGVDSGSVASGMIGAAGGAIEADGVSIDIPPGALDADVMITATPQSDPPGEYDGLSPVYQFGPEGTVFKKPVTIRFKLSRADARAVVYFTKLKSSEFEDIGGSVSGSQIDATVLHFSQGFAGLPTGGTGSGPDGAASGLDSGTPDADAGPQTGIDGGTPSIDGGKPSIDASTTSDAGPGAHDAGGATADGGSTGHDGGETQLDAGSPQSDAGSTTDAGASGAGHVTITSRNSAGAFANQTWAAWQDGDGAWQPLAATSTGKYEIDVAAARFGVAFVCAAQGDQQTSGHLVYGLATTSAVDVRAETYCAPVTQPTSATLTGTLSNLPANTLWFMAGMRDSSFSGQATITNNSAPYTLYNFHKGTTYDVAFGAASSTSLLKMTILRDLDFSDNLVRDVDFNSVGYDVGSANVSVSNASASTGLSVYYTTGGAALGMALTVGPASGTTTRSITYGTVPEALRIATDSYQVTASESSQTESREVQRRFVTSGAVDLTMPASLTVSFDWNTTPYLRPIANITLYAGADEYQTQWTYGPSKGVSHAFSTVVDPAWFSGAAPHLVEMPDFSNLAGFQSAWVAPASASAGQVYVSATAIVNTTLLDGTLTEKVQKASSVP